MTVETKAEFARRLGKHRSYITRAAQQGRLVLDDNGNVLVEESVLRLEATKRGRHAVEDRWNAYRTASSQNKKEVLPPLGLEDSSRRSDGQVVLSLEEIGRRTRLAQMKKEEAEAEKRRRELDELRKNQVPRDDIRRALNRAASIILGQAENLPERITFQVYKLDGREQVRTRIQDEVDSFLRNISNELLRICDKEEINT